MIQPDIFSAFSAGSWLNSDADGWIKTTEVALSRYGVRIRCHSKSWAAEAGKEGWDKVTNARTYPMVLSGNLRASKKDLIPAHRPAPSLHTFRRWLLHFDLYPWLFRRFMTVDIPCLWTAPAYIYPWAASCFPRPNILAKQSLDDVFRWPTTFPRAYLKQSHILACDMSCRCLGWVVVCLRSRTSAGGRTGQPARI